MNQCGNVIVLDGKNNYFANKNTAIDLERVTAANDKWNELLTSANQVLTCHDCAVLPPSNSMGGVPCTSPHHTRVRLIDPLLRLNGHLVKERP